MKLILIFKTPTSLLFIFDKIIIALRTNYYI